VIFTVRCAPSNGDYTRPRTVRSGQEGTTLSGFRISCPNCGERAVAEFAFGGERIAFPEGGVETLEQNYERVWLRANLRGPQTEQWFHTAGCRRWITVVRDTSTNEPAAS
jgi:heterotetrameric sarcosine oxidase delta subunit